MRRPGVLPKSAQPGGYDPKEFPRAAEAYEQRMEAPFPGGWWVVGVSCGSKLCPWRQHAKWWVSFGSTTSGWSLEFRPQNLGLFRPTSLDHPHFFQLFFGGRLISSISYKHLDVQTDTSWSNSSILKTFQHEVIQEAGELIFVPSGWHHEALGNMSFPFRTSREAPSLKLTAKEPLKSYYCISKGNGLV